MKRLLIVVAVVLAVVSARVRAQQNGSTIEKRFASAEHKANVEGDLKGAIEEYKRIVAAAAKDRPTAARALLSMAEAYQKLGDAEATRIYRELVARYHDQKQVYATAVTRLGVENRSGQNRVSFSQAWTLGTRRTADGAVSRDGRYLAYVDWDRNGNLFVHDFRSNSDRPLTNSATDGLPEPKVEQFAEEHSFSRDGRQLAYAWFRANLDGGRFELRLLDLKGDGIPESRLLYDNPDVSWIGPFDWSPDGKWIAVLLTRRDKTGQIGLISVTDGSLQVLRSVEWRGASMLAFSPDGKYLAYDLPASTESDQRDVFVLASAGDRHIPAVVGPNQDRIVGWSNDGKRLLFASDRTGSMALWSVGFHDGKVDSSYELLRADIGNISSLGVTDSGTLYIKVNNGAGSNVHVAAVDFVSKQVAEPSLAAQTFVGSNRFPAWSPDGTRLAYVSQRGTIGSRRYVIAVRSKDDVSELTPSPALDLIQSLTWARDGSLIVKGRDLKGNYALFRVEPQSGHTSTLVVQGDGPETLLANARMSPDGRRIVYAKRLWNSDSVPVQEPIVWLEKDLTTGNQKELTRTRSAMLSPDGQYLVIVGAPNKPRILVVRRLDGSDARELADTGDVQQLFLQWALDSRAVYAMKGSRELWRLPIDGSQPAKVDIRPGSNVAVAPQFSIHPDGGQIAFETQPTGRMSAGGEVWMLANFLPQ